MSEKLNAEVIETVGEIVSKFEYNEEEGVFEYFARLKDRKTQRFLIKTDSLELGNIVFIQINKETGKAKITGRM